ncbi:hypothetical protein D1831_08645 [Lactiplantibacillus garii]|uniref:Uncharacterized protein n=1 Tax=Lactiplantibacillus garii TaxID=2306423 RepID=A0A426D6L9_9LACO|nr:hypothetical protein [Lactiplantibacillus garii]RRK10220.1 hypothetical protein D1831_08645 [Lactiplantibacillus garii]
MTETTVCQQFDRVVRQMPAKERVAFYHFWQAFLDAHLERLMMKYDCTDVYELATHHPEVYREWIVQFKTLLYVHGVNEHHAADLGYDEVGNLKINKAHGTLTIPVGA